MCAPDVGGLPPWPGTLSLTALGAVPSEVLLREGKDYCWGGSWLPGQLWSQGQGQGHGGLRPFLRKLALGLLSPCPPPQANGASPS